MRKLPTFDYMDELQVFQAQKISLYANLWFYLLDIVILTCKPQHNVI